SLLSQLVRRKDVEQPRISGSMAEESVAAVAPPSVEKDPQVVEFGRSSLPAISTDATILFLDGRYVTPPYRIRRSELKLYVNDLPYRTYNWPGKEYVADDPPVPPALKRMSKFGELDDS